MNRIIAVNASLTEISFMGKIWPSSCLVRTIDNGLRKRHDPKDVYLSTNADGSDGKPIMPNRFPRGRCAVIGVMFPSDPTTDLGPAIVRTDAKVDSYIWALDPAGGYDHETAMVIPDWGYEFHYSDTARFGIYSAGCIHLRNLDDAVIFADMVQMYLNDGDTVEVEVQK